MKLGNTWVSWGLEDADTDADAAVAAVAVAVVRCSCNCGQLVELTRIGMNDAQLV